MTTLAAQPTTVAIADSTTRAEPTIPVTRRRVDLLLVALGSVVAIVMAVAGGLLLWGSNFASDYVHRELASQQIFFPSADALNQEGRTDLLGYADTQVTSGQDARAYASYIDHHLDGIGDGKTYSQLGAVERAANADVQAAVDAGSSEAEVAALQAKADDVTNSRNTVFKGETLRGLLLSTFAWWQIGQIAGFAAIVAFVAAAVMAVLVVFGLVHIRRHHQATT
jgi:hypothetical protein